MSRYEIQIEGAVFAGDDLPLDSPRNGRTPMMSVGSSRTPSEPIWNPAGLQADALKAAERIAVESVPLDGRLVSAEVYRVTKDGRRVRVCSCTAQLDGFYVLVDSTRGYRRVRASV